MSDNMQNTSDSLQVPALITESNLANTLVSIQKDLEQINQHKHASPEFRALMDGYVNKANEAEYEKIKYKNIEEKYEELKSELRSLKDLTKKQESDLDATREALKASESDLFKIRQEFSYYKDSADSKIQELSEDKRNLNQKVRDLLADKEKSSAEIQNAQMKVMEANHRYKQLEQERGLDKDNYDRALRETENMVAELREQLDLRTRELEYKDALLNQLIKQVSEPNSMLSQTMAQAVPQTMPRQQQTVQQRPLVQQPLPSQQAMNDLPNEFKRDLFAQPKSGSTYSTAPVAEPARPGAMRWGAIRK